MKLTEKGENVTLEMARDDWQNLLVAVTIASSLAFLDKDQTAFRSWMDFFNRLNAADPRYTPLDFPEEFKVPHP